jgi:hypothetical protein
MEIPTLWTIDNAGWAVIYVEQKMGEPDRVWCIATGIDGIPFKTDADTPAWFLYYARGAAEKALDAWRESGEYEEGCDFKVCRIQMAAVAVKATTGE